MAIQNPLGRAIAIADTVRRLAAGDAWDASATRIDPGPGISRVQVYASRYR